MQLVSAETGAMIEPEVFSPLIDLLMSHEHIIMAGVPGGISCPLSSGWI